MTQDQKEMYFFIKAQLDCGAEIQIMQRQLGTPLEFIITSKSGTQIQDFARIHDGELRVNATTESVIGLYQLLRLVFNPLKKRKFLGLF